MIIKKEQDKKIIKKKISRIFRITLGMKTSFVVSLVVIALAVFTMYAIVAAFRMFAVDEEIQRLYAVGSTSLGIIGTVSSERACDKVVNIYKSIPEEQRKNPADSAYLEYFLDLDNDIDEEMMDYVYNVIHGKNEGIVDVGLCIIDDENKRLINVRNLKKVPSGYWDDFNYKSARTFSENPLNDYYTTEIDDNKVYYFRVLVPIDAEASDEVHLKGFLYIDERNDILNGIILVFSFIFTFVYIFIIIFVWIILSLTMKRIVIRPIKKLSRAANEWADSPDKLADTYYFKDIKLRKTNDEINDLREAMTEMETKLHEYMLHIEEVTMEKQRVYTELEFAARLQANMLPDKLKLTGQTFDISSTMRPARTVGGDFYDFFMIDNDRLAMVIADVSDKGIPASLFMVVSKTIINNMLNEIPDDISKAIEKANNQLCDNNVDMMFVTVFACIYSISKKTIDYVNAGHEDPIVYRKDEGKYSYIIEDHDIFMGINDDLPFTRRSIEFNEGDRLFLYTDGVTEAMNTEDELFGTTRLLDVLNDDTAIHGDELINKVWDNIDRFQTGKNQSDDVTMLLFEI